MYVVLPFCIYLGIDKDMNVVRITVVEFRTAALMWKCPYCT